MMQKDRTDSTEGRKDRLESIIIAGTGMSNKDVLRTRPDIQEAPPSVGRTLARILEKQNSLQMSRVFPFPGIGIRWVLLFKDSISEAASPNRFCSHAALLPLHFAGLRSGLARAILR